MLVLCNDRQVTVVSLWGQGYEGSHVDESVVVVLGGLLTKVNEKSLCFALVDVDFEPKRPEARAHRPQKNLQRLVQEGRGSRSK